MGAAVGLLASWAIEGATTVLSAFGVTGVSAGAFFATAIGIQLAGYALIGGALSLLAPDIGTDTHAGQKLQTQKSNTNPVPLVYGQNRLGGNIIFQKTNNYNGGTTNNDYWAIIAISEGEIEEYLKVYANEDELTKDSANTFTSKYVQAKTYTTSNDGINLYDVSFITDENATEVLGSAVFGTPTVTASNPADLDKLTDGDIVSVFSRWRGASINNQWIKIDLGSQQSFTNAKIYINNDTSVYNYEFKLQYSDDDTTWIDCSDTYVNSGDSGRSWYTLVNNETSKHQYYRIYFNTISQFDAEALLEPTYVYELDFTSENTTSLSIPPNLAFIAVHQKYVATNLAHVQLDNLSVEVKGKKITFVGSELIDYEYGDSGYSYQPIDILYDIMNTYMGVSASEINTQNFLDTKIHTNSNELFCNICFTEKVNFESALQSVLATIRGYLFYSNGQWNITHDKQKTVVKTITESDILQGSLIISMMGLSELFNKVTVKYINPLDEWQSAQITYQDDDLISLDGQEIEKIIDIRGITSKEHATKMGIITLNQARYSEDENGNRLKQTPLDIEFSTTIKNAELEVGDLIEVEHNLLNYKRKFNIISIVSQQSGVIKVQCKEYCTTHYKDSNNNEIWS